MICRIINKTLVPKKFNTIMIINITIIIIFLVTLWVASRVAKGRIFLKDLCKSCSYDIKKVVKGLNCYYGHLAIASYG